MSTPLLGRPAGPATPAPPAAPSLVPLLAVGAGVAVADNYWLQPLLALMARDLGVGVGAMGAVSALALLGYALGLLLVVPLGDVVDRRPLVTGILGLTTLSLVAMATAPSLPALAVATFGVGLTSVVAQVLVPYAVSLADDASRGRVAGTMMRGVLTGIVSARVVSGLLGEAVGWRAVYGGAAGLTAALLVVLLRRLPAESHRHRRNGRPDVPYAEVLRGVGRLARQHKGLRVRAVYGLCGFAVFSAVWTTLAFHLRDAYGVSSAGVAAVATLGFLGAVAVPRFGGIADRGHVHAVTGWAYAGLLLGSALLATGTSSLPMLLVALVVVDLSVQAGHVASLSAVYGIAPTARSGATTVYMTTVFAGGALGSVLAAVAYGAAGWPAVSAVCAAFATGALALFLVRVHVGAPVALDDEEL